MLFSIIVTSVHGRCPHVLATLCPFEVKYVDGATDEQGKAIAEAAQAEYNKGKTAGRCEVLHRECQENLRVQYEEQNI